jgi:putative Holliday junction resolvase
MPLVELHALPDLLPPRARLLGLDLGSKTIGLAISDGELRLASPLETIRRGKFTADAARLKEIVAERRVGGLVLGLPVNMDGSEGPRCQSTRQFARNLDQVAGLELPVALWDERLSTAAVERFLVDEADMTRKRRGEVVDKMAAGYILQGALDALARGPRDENGGRGPDA